MKTIRAFAVAMGAAAFLGLAGMTQAQYSGGMGYGNGMMPGPHAASGFSGIARPAGPLYGMMVGNYCSGMMGPAVGYGYPMVGPWTGSAYADPDAAVQACLSGLHSQLGISSTQEAAWQAFADAVVEQARQMLQFQQQVSQASATAPARAAQYADFMQQRAQDAAAISVAVSALYATLDPAQVDLFNRYFAWGG